MIAALYVERGGPYFTMPDVDPWDVARDARTYAGPWPIVAHPPCGPWGALRHLYKGSEHDCAPRAVEQIRRFGGVLEHPARSLLWRHAGLPAPGVEPDAFGGFAVEIDQCAWGHVARKKTWLYCVSVDRMLVESMLRTGGIPTHWVSGLRSSTGRNPRHYQQSGSAVPPGIRICSAQQRRRTPPLFARWLVDIAWTAWLFGGEGASGS